MPATASRPRLADHLQFAAPRSIAGLTTIRSQPALAASAAAPRAFSGSAQTVGITRTPRFQLLQIALVEIPLDELRRVLQASPRPSCAATRGTPPALVVVPGGADPGDVVAAQSTPRSLQATSSPRCPARFSAGSSRRVGVRNGRLIACGDRDLDRGSLRLGSDLGRDLEFELVLTRRITSP